LEHPHDTHCVDVHNSRNRRRRRPRCICQAHPTMGVDMENSRCARLRDGVLDLLLRRATARSCDALTRGRPSYEPRSPCDQANHPGTSKISSPSEPNSRVPGIMTPRVMLSPSLDEARSLRSEMSPGQASRGHSVSSLPLPHYGDTSVTVATLADLKITTWRRSA
jgi:hypothetical protein